MHIYCKNARLHSNVKLLELVGEIQQCMWDVVLFSETRADIDKLTLDGGHLLYGSRKATTCAGVAIALHSKHKTCVQQVRVLDDRLMYLDLKNGARVIRLVSVYMPHAGYPIDDLRRLYEQLQFVLEDARRRGFTYMVGGDFNTQLGVGTRGDLLEQMCLAYGLAVLNRDSRIQESWTFESSMGIRRRIDFLLCHVSLSVQSACTSCNFDLGSDHRAVHGCIEVEACRKPRFARQRCRRGWHPTAPTKILYQSLLDDWLRKSKPQTLSELEDGVKHCVEQAESCTQRSTDARKPWEREDFRYLLQQRRQCRCAVERAHFSKLIRKHLRCHMRLRRNEKLNEILNEFSSLNRLHAVRDDGIKRHSCSTQPSPDDFADFLENIFSTEDDSHASLPFICPQPCVDKIPAFDDAELQLALKQLRNGKSADGDGLVLEMFIHAGGMLHQRLLSMYNHMLHEHVWDPKWCHTVFNMLPKPGDASVASNWRPIAILKVTYKIFSKMLCSRLQPLLESYQSPDQVGFRPHRGTDHAFAVFDTICGKSVEWNCNLWFASLDLKKAFDRMEHNALFAALAKQGVESSYIQLLKALYLGQTGSVHGSRRFRITRGVKQGDVLSPLLFNAGLEAAIQSWKSRIADCGIHVGHIERLTNIRFADDLMVYSKSSSELAYMLEVLSEELLKVGLQLNPQKTKILTTTELASPMYLDVHGDMISVLHGKDQHPYLGRLLCGHLRERAAVEYSHRIRVAWHKFHLHRQSLLNKHVSLKNRLKLFQAVVTPAVLYGLSTLPLTDKQFADLDVVQRRMLRSIVGWRRVDGEEWVVTMRRMNSRVSYALCQHPIPNWTKQLRSRKFTLASRLAGQLGWHFHTTKWLPTEQWWHNFSEKPSRKPGRPATRWDDDLNMFAATHLDRNSWIDCAASSPEWCALQSLFIS